MKKVFSLLFFIFIMCGAQMSFASAPIFVQAAAPFSTSGASTGSVTISSFTSGHVGIVIASNGKNGSYIPTISGCSATWEPIIINPYYPSFNDVAVFMSYNIGTGSCSPLATYPGSVGFNLFFLEYSGMTSNMVIDIASGSARGGTSGFSILTQGSNELIMEIINAGPGSSGCTAIGDSTYSNTRGSLLSSSTSGLTTGILDTTGNAGTWSYSATGFVCSFPQNLTGILIGFRSSMPSLGRLQYSIFDTTASHTYREPNLGGDSLVALCGYSNASPLATPAPTDSSGNAWLPLPSPIASDSSNFYNLWWVPSAIAGSNTVSCPSASAASIGITLWEITPSYFGGYSSFFTADTLSSWSSGPINCQSNCILFSVAASISSTATFTASSGFAQTMYSGSAVIDALYSYDKTVNLGSGYFNTIIQTGSGNFPQVFVIAFEQSALSVPFVRQRARGSGGAGPDGSFTATFPTSVKLGDLILKVGANQSGQSPGTTSDTQGNVYHLLAGNGSTQFSFMYAIAGSTGSDAVTDTNTNCIGAVDLGVPGTPALDQTNQATNGGALSLSTGNITTTTNSELLVSTAYDISSSFRLFYESMSSGWSGVLFTCGAHEAAAWMGLQLQEPIGTYSNIFTFGDSMPLSAAIASFDFAEGGPTVVRGKTTNRGKTIIR